VLGFDETVNDRFAITNEGLEIDKDFTLLIVFIGIDKQDEGLLNTLTWATIIMVSRIMKILLNKWITNIEMVFKIR
jgi:hypothetical protein